MKSQIKKAKTAALDMKNKMYKTFYKDSKKLFKEILDKLWNDQWMLLSNNKLREIKATVIPFDNAEKP